MGWGRAFLLVAVPIVTALAMVMRSSALVALALWGAVLLFEAARSARDAARGLGARRLLYPSAFEGDTVSVQLQLENRSRRPAYLVLISDGFGAALRERHLMLEPGPLPARSRRRLQYRAECTRSWGVHVVGPLTLHVADPLGLFPRARTLGQHEPFSVFPRVYEVAGLDRLGALASLTPQEATAGRTGHGAVYLGVRDYRSGDDVRRVHWPATARRGSVVVKEYEVDLVPYFSLFLDLHARGRAGTGLKSTLEYVVRTAASILWSATRRGDFVQLFGEGARPLALPPGRGDLHLAHALSELIQVRQDGSTPLLELVERSRGYLPAGSTAALLSASAQLDLRALALRLEELRGAGVRPLLVLVDGDSFVPVDRWPLPRAQAEAHLEATFALLRDHGVPGALLRADMDLAPELARPDLLGPA